MQKSDLRNLLVMIAVAIVLAIGSAWLFRYGLNSEAGNTPSAAHATTNWIQSPATDIAEDVRAEWSWTVGILTPFLFGPLLVLGYCILRFNHLKNPKAATFHEHVSLEVFWTIVPAFFLIAMAVPAYSVLHNMDHAPRKADLEVDVVGAQFYWQYTLPKYGVTVTDDGTGTSPVVFPVDKMIRLNGQSHQVNHAWWVPSFGVKFDVIPGRITGAWFTTKREGLFKGQCAELCGALHAFMWIHVKVVPEKEFYEWLKSKDAVFPTDEREKVVKYLGQEYADSVFKNVPAAAAP